MSLNARLSDWRDKRIWIIGASSGIGAALAHALLELGADVIVSSRNQNQLHIEFASYETHCLIAPLDITQIATVDEVFQKILATYNGIDLVVICAGTYQPMRAWQMDAQVMQDTVATNLSGVLNCLPPIIELYLKQGGGGIALVSSVAGYRGLPESLVYGATKAALINLCETLYLDLAPSGIAVYLINPGFVKTPLTDKNTFAMPALISAADAATEIIQGIEQGQFEIHFPKRFTLCLKWLRLLPYRWYFPLIRKMTGL